MHSLVRWRACYEGDLTEYRHCYVKFITAACFRMLHEEEQVHF